MLGRPNPPWMSYTRFSDAHLQAPRCPPLGLHTCHVAMHNAMESGSKSGQVNDSLHTCHVAMQWSEVHQQERESHESTMACTPVTSQRTMQWSVECGAAATSQRSCMRWE
jgi:hypothetical protein